MKETAKPDLSVTIHLPRVLAELTACERSVSVTGHTVGEALHDLIRRCPPLALHLFDDTGALRRHILCFRNAVSIEARAQLDQSLTAGDSLTLVNSVAGG